ncbi:hypothetical protein [Pseudobacter ginsenosidimutans]|uniref:SH3 domain-containing protein n=1 Tax=Pseudobacter ginsenosidimutans TaxID=661488 RepID=A0A4Q7N663_9BACT|nr:hypothetical protein [Pseudobacter ginsenosidimutans]QEC45068.1 hypothetical protein FSB84_26530 [Pseudobacter ginsenosidimutans]RZS76563.1 hypothetical protein EV199_2449 [Pseudobacter ginsenosidimutans]
MKIFLLLILCCAARPALSQFAFIADKDGQANIRTSATIADNIEDSLQNGHLVYCMENDGNWVNIDYIKNGASLTGYIYRNRLIMVEQYEKITQLSSQPHQLSFGKDSLSITIRSQPFYRPKNKLFFSTEYPGIVELINGKLPFGTDGNMPNTAYQSIEIQTGSRKTIVPAGEFADLFEPNFNKTSVNYDRRQDILYIHAMNSDGAGGYLVIWRIVKGEYRDRFVAYGF